MNVLGKRDIYGEAEDHAEVRPPGQLVQAAGEGLAQSSATQQLSHRRAYRRRGGGSDSARGDVEGLGQGREHHERGDKRQYDGRFQLLGKVEAEPPRRSHPAPDHRPGQHQQKRRGEDVDVDGHDAHACLGQQPRGERPPHGVPVGDHQVAQNEGQESPEYEGVGQPRPVPQGYALEHFALTEYKRDGSDDPADRLVEPADGLSDEDEPDHSSVENEPSDREHDR